MTKPTYDIVETARRSRYIREVKNPDGSTSNRGLRVEAIQHWSGGQFGDSWCAEILWRWFDEAYQGNPPFDRFQSCEVFHQLAIKHGWIVTEDPHPGDIVLSVHSDTKVAHHIALLTSNDPMTAIAGNTSPDGTSSNGDGVYEHYITGVNKVFVRVP